MISPMNFIFLGLITRKGQSSVSSKKASDYKNNQNTNMDKEDASKKNDKLVNVIYNDGEYHLYEP